MSSSKRTANPTAKVRKYGRLAQLNDRFHGWLDGFQHRPDVNADDVRTPYWLRLEKWAAGLYIEEQLRFSEEFGPFIAQYKADLKELEFLAQQLDGLGRTLAQAQQELDTAKQRLDRIRDLNPDRPETFEDRRQRKLQLFEVEKAVRLAAAAVEKARREYQQLDSAIIKRGTDIRRGEEEGRTRANQAWVFAHQRIGVYCQSLVRSHPQGHSLQLRLSRMTTDPPAFHNGMNAGSSEIEGPSGG